MNIPKYVEIGNSKYKVVEEDLKEESLGYTCLNDGVISVNKKLNEPRKKETLFHEMIEAINFEYDLHLKHHTICLLHLALYSLIERNKRMFTS